MKFRHKNRLKIYTVCLRSLFYFCNDLRISSCYFGSLEFLYCKVNVEKIIQWADLEKNYILFRFQNFLLINLHQTWWIGCVISYDGKIIKNKKKNFKNFDKNQIGKLKRGNWTVKYGRDNYQVPIIMELKSNWFNKSYNLLLKTKQFDVIWPSK